MEQKIHALVDILEVHLVEHVQLVALQEVLVQVLLHARPLKQQRVLQREL